MATPPPLPESVSLPDLPVIRRRAYLAVATQEPGLYSARWHIWHAGGTYVGYCTTAELIDLTIAQDERRRGQ
ncbi:hypothetical protein ACGFRG_08700 [Streptomyces sp. NPDC048696]|uniref:hypothetical protein n=1 Tax=Streptomyces sp. NPDC048696 TaxID=3365585 RepID=UPI00371B0BEC